MTAPKIPDSDVAPRYTHGELQLKRSTNPHKLFLEAPGEDKTYDEANEEEIKTTQLVPASSYKAWSVSSSHVQRDDPSTPDPSLFEIASLLVHLSVVWVFLIWSWKDATAKMRWLVLGPLGIVLGLATLLAIAGIVVYVWILWDARELEKSKKGQLEDRELWVKIKLSKTGGDLV